MRTYFMKFRFTHPTTEDFLRTIEQVAVAAGRATVLPAGHACAGRPVRFADVPPVNSSLRPYFNQAVMERRCWTMRWIASPPSPVEWWVPEPKDKNARKQIPYLSTVYLHRKGDFVLPVTVEIVFDDGTRLRDHWDGVDRWKKLSYVRNAKVVSAEIDPDHVGAAGCGSVQQQLHHQGERSAGAQAGDDLGVGAAAVCATGAWIV